MSIDFLPPVASIQAPSLEALQLPLVDGTHAAVGSFSTLVSDGLREVSTQLRAGEADLQHLATGDVQNLHQVMIKLEETRLSFQLMLQVRNRLLESYQEVMRMQV